MGQKNNYFVITTIWLPLQLCYS